MSDEAKRYQYAEVQHIGALARNSKKQWGDPVENRKRLVPYGFGPIDNALYGILPGRNFYDAPAEFGVLQGPEKGRKSTTMQNFVKNVQTYARLKEKPTMVIDILESSSGPEIVKDNFVCMIASEYIMQVGHTSHQPCKLCGGKQCRELTLSSRSLPFTTKSRLQQRAIDRALQDIESWNLFLFGPGLSEGNTRDMDGTLRRWKWLAENYGATIFIPDHVQQYNLANQRGGLSDYEKQQVVVPALSTFVGQERLTVLALSQLSLGTRKSDGRQYAIGGARMASEANTVLQSYYDEDNPTQVAVRIMESRYSGKLKAWSWIDPSSGLFHGEMGYDPLIPQEREMTDEERENSPFND